MFDLPFKLFPPALLAGVSIWGLASVLWLQPLVEERMAEKTLIPRCEAGLLKAERAIPERVDPRKAEIAIMEDMIRATGLGDLPFVTEALNTAKRHADAASPKRLRSSKIDRDSLCACSVDKAFSEAFYPMALHVASLRSHTPSGIRTIEASVLQVAASGTCGALPWQKG